MVGCLERTRQARIQRTATHLSGSPGISKHRDKQHVSQKARQHSASHMKAMQTLCEEAESDTASSSNTIKAVQAKEAVLRDASTRSRAPTSATAHAMQLQLPKTGLTMAMTCCDMEDQTQDVNFLPSTPTYDTSDFVFFRTNTDQREFSSAQAMPVQHDYLQTAPSPSGTATRTVQQPGNKPMFSSDSVTTSGQPVPNKHTPVSKITASSSCPAKRDATASPKLPPPVAPRRKLPQHLFAPLSRAVAKSGPVFPPAIPSSASQPSSLLQALMERDAEQRSLEHQMQMQAVTAAFGADLRSVRQGSAPVSSAHALLHKLSMHRGVSCKE